MFAIYTIANRLLFAGTIIVTMVPSVAFAQESCARQRTNRVLATAGGAVVGGGGGYVVADRGDKTIGTVIGAAVGAVIGNQIAKPDANCRPTSGYYDGQGRWIERPSYDNRDGAGMPSEIRAPARSGSNTVFVLRSATAR